MCNTAYNLKAVFFFSCFSIIIHFKHPFAVAACAHSNMSVKSAGASAPPPPPTSAYTLANDLELSIMPWVSAVEECPLSGVLLYC